MVNHVSAKPDTPCESDSTGFGMSPDPRLEFVRRDEYPVLTDMAGGGPFRLPPGEWTDDTAMALALPMCWQRAGKMAMASTRTC